MIPSSLDMMFTPNASALRTLSGRRYQESPPSVTAFVTVDLVEFMGGFYRSARNLLCNGASRQNGIELLAFSSPEGSFRSSWLRSATQTQISEEAPCDERSVFAFALH